MLMPKRVKYRKQHIRHPRGKASRGSTINFGEYGLVTMKPAFITARQIEAARVAMTRHMKKGGKLWIRVFPDLSVTSKPAETRMGGGKGSPEYWVVPVEAGRVLFELGGLKEDTAREALRLAAFKLPVKTSFVKRA